MHILNVSISHNSKDWLSCLTIEIEKTKRGLNLKKRCWFNSETPFGYWVIIRAVDLGFRSDLSGWKAKTYA